MSSSKFGRIRLDLAVSVNDLCGMTSLHGYVKCKTERLFQAEFADPFSAETR